MNRSSAPARRTPWLGGALAIVIAAAGCGEVSTGADDAGGGSGSAVTELAPYFYAYGWGNPAYAFTSLSDMKAKGGPSAVSLAFVLAGTSCNVATDVHDHLDQIRAYVADGGHVKASFGGATGTYLEYACGSATELAGALGRFVADTGITDLDFDLEQHGQSSNPTLNAMRGAALKQLQVANKNVRVAFTLPLAPTGLLQESIDILQAAISAGVEISFVNGLAMDYGDGTDLGTVPAKSIDGLAIQVRALLPSLSLAQVYRRLGATAMIGKNDDNETLSFANAQTLVDYARQKQLGLLSFWAIHRDQVCPTSNDLALCSRLNTKPFEFYTIFAGVNR